MSSLEKRKHYRYDTLNLLHITVFDGEVVIHQGMGRTLNVSESGILLETTFALTCGDDVALSIGFEEEIVEIRGRAMRCIVGEQEVYETGVSFSSLDDKTSAVLNDYIEAFEAHHSKA
jgi:PilZ domain